MSQNNYSKQFSQAEDDLYELLNVTLVDFFRGKNKKSLSSNDLNSLLKDVVEKSKKVEEIGSKYLNSFKNTSNVIDDLIDSNDNLDTIYSGESIVEKYIEEVINKYKLKVVPKYFKK